MDAGVGEFEVEHRTFFWKVVVEKPLVQPESYAIVDFPNQLVDFTILLVGNFWATSGQL